MGEWNTSIYTNDYAMDLIGDMSDDFNKGINPIDIICQQLDKLSGMSGDRDMLVLADFELFLTGKIFYTSDIIKAIDNLLENDMERWEDWAESREKELLKFKQKILDSKNTTPVIRTNEEIANWFEEKSKNDIL